MTIPTTEQKIAHLRRAQDLLRHHGWCRFTTHDRLGQICALEALARAGFNDDLDEIVSDMLFPDRPYMDPISRICGYNNHEATCVEDVIAQFQITIDRLEASLAPDMEREQVNA